MSCMLNRFYAWKVWHFLRLNVVHFWSTDRVDVSDLSTFLTRLSMTETNLQLWSWRYVNILGYLWVKIVAFSYNKTQVHDFEEASTKSTGEIYTLCYWISIFIDMKHSFLSTQKPIPQFAYHLSIFILVIMLYTFSFSNLFFWSTFGCINFLIWEWRSWFFRDFQPADIQLPAFKFLSYKLWNIFQTLNLKSVRT